MAKARLRAALARRTSMGVFYEGTRAELVHAGIVPEGCFPGDPGKRPIATSSWLPDGGRINVLKVAHKADLFKAVQVAPDPAALAFLRRIRALDRKLDQMLNPRRST